MPYYLTKVLPLLIMPVPVAILLGLVALILIFLGHRRSGIGSLMTAVIILWVSSLPPVASALLWTLQKQYPPVGMESVPESQCIIVLGGVVGDAEYPRVEPELSESIDRVYQAARLYRLGKGRRLIVAAGNQPWAKDLEPEANIIRLLLIEWGVPKSAISLDASSRNTRENAINGAELIREANCQSNLLVTSAWHMPRAVATFEALGMSIFPVSVDIRGVPGRNVLFFQFIPRADALSITSQVIMEWMGIWVYRWRGWN